METSMVAERLAEIESMSEFGEGEKNFMRKLVLSGVNLDLGGRVHSRDKFKGMILEEKYFRRMEKFGGKPELWNEWFFNFSVAIGQVGDKGSSESEVWRGRLYRVTP